MSKIIDLNDKKKKVKLASPIPSYKVRINYHNVKYLEDAPGGKTRVHFVDNTSLLVNKSIGQTNADMMKMLTITKK